MTIRKLLLGTIAASLLAIGPAMAQPCHEQVSPYYANPATVECEAEKRRQATQAEIAAQARAHEAAHKQAEALAAQNEWLSHPPNQLNLFYQKYLYVESCHQARDGYLLVWVNDVQMERVKLAMTRLETAILKEDPTIDTAAVWDKVGKLKLPAIYQYGCQVTYNELIQAAPSLPIVKDFGTLTVPLLPPLGGAVGYSLHQRRKKWRSEPWVWRFSPTASHSSTSMQRGRRSGFLY
jgi:hypothetical protein